MQMDRVRHCIPPLNCSPSLKGLNPFWPHTFKCFHCFKNPRRSAGSEILKPACLVPTTMTWSSHWDHIFTNYDLNVTWHSWSVSGIHSIHSAAATRLVDLMIARMGRFSGVPIKMASECLEACRQQDLKGPKWNSKSTWKLVKFKVFILGHVFVKKGAVIRTQIMLPWKFLSTFLSDISCLSFGVFSDVVIESSAIFSPHQITLLSCIICFCVSLCLCPHFSLLLLKKTNSNFRLSNRISKFGTSHSLARYQ